jgi:2-C-methyl-D-erythritol 4-phosphate cytidylyltransferase/2-C-methyl-D-erythritol 2,4-cyclodiphosphate synthase
VSRPRSPAGKVQAWVIVLAAGTGERLGRKEPKAFLELAGRPMIEWSLVAIERSRAVSGAVLAVPPTLLMKAKAIARAFPIVQAVLAGGDTRQASVRAALGEVPGSIDVIVCHDAARPLAGSELFDRVVEALGKTGAAGAVPVVASADTVKRVRDGIVAETVPRDEIGLAQTPQAFLATALTAAHAEGGNRWSKATDDAMLLESSGHRVAVVPGDPSNFKVTTADDLHRANEILEARRRAATESAGG